MVNFDECGYFTTFPKRGEYHPLVEEICVRVKTVYSQLTEVELHDDIQQLFNETFGKISEVDGESFVLSTLCILPSLVSADAAIRAESNDAKTKLFSLWQQVLSQKEVYDKLLQIDEKAKSYKGPKPLEHEQLYLMEKTLSQCRRFGAALGEEEKKKYNDLKATLSTLSNQFEKNIFEDNTFLTFPLDDLNGVPENILQSFPDLEGKKKVSMKAPFVQPIIRFCNIESTRKKVHEVYQQRCYDTNYKVLQQMLSIRSQMANLLGTPDSFSDPTSKDSFLDIKGYVLAFSEGIASPSAACELLQKVGSDLKPLLRQDMAFIEKAEELFLHGPSSAEEQETALRQAMKEIYSAPVAASSSSRKGIATYNLSYYQRKILELLLNLDENALFPYFEMNNVVDRILSLYGEEFSICFEEVKDLPRWDEDVRVFDVYTAAPDSNTRLLLGEIYFDLLPREGKFSHQCVFPLRPSFFPQSQREKCTNEQQKHCEGDKATVLFMQRERRYLPSCALLCNMSSKDAQHRLLSFQEVETLFHEVGHMIHCVLSQVSYTRQAWSWNMAPCPSGVETDYLETPSQLMENWVYEKNILCDRLSSHYVTKESLPEEILHKLQQTRHFLEAPWKIRQIYMSLWDLMVHSRDPLKSNFFFEGSEHDWESLWHTMFDQIGHCNKSFFMPVNWTHMTTYAANYYSYLWSEVYSCDVYVRYKELESLSSRQSASSLLRDKLFSPGASKSGHDMVTSFLGRPVDHTPFLKQIAPVLL